MQSIINSHLENGRQVLSIKVCGTDYTKLFSGLENIQPKFNSSKILKFNGNVEICRNEDPILRQRSDSSESEKSVNADDGGDMCNCEPRGRKRFRTSKEAQQIQIEEKIMDILTVPITDFIITDYILIFDSLIQIR